MDAKSTIACFFSDDITAEDVLSLILDGEDDYSNSENEKKVDQTEKKQSTPQPTLMTNMAEEKSDPETEGTCISKFKFE